MYKPIPVSHLTANTNGGDSIVCGPSSSNASKTLSRRVRVFIEHPTRKGHYLFLYREFKNSDGKKLIKIVLPGGGVENGETVYEALSRETLEELGVDYQFTPNNTLFVTREVVTRFGAKITDSTVTPNQENSDEPVSDDFMQLIFFELKGVFDHIPRNMEKDKGTVGISWERLQDIYKKISAPDKAVSEYGYVGQTALFGAIDSFFYNKFGKSITSRYYTDPDEREARNAASRAETGSKYAKEHDFKVKPLSALPSTTPDEKIMTEDGEYPFL